jgi:hypothetical protein
MLSVSLRTVLARLLGAYNGWMSDSHVGLADAERLLENTRSQFDAGHARGVDRPWCWRCGEDFRAYDEAGVGTRDGIHARCYGG